LATDETLVRGERGKLFRPLLDPGRRAVGDQVSSLKNVRRHEKIACVDAPTFGLERSTHARGAGKGVVGRPDFDPAPFQGSKNEWKEPGLVADVSHDDPWANLPGSILEPLPRATGKSVPPGVLAAGSMEWQSHTWN
jgi:hypothetical protein